MRPSNSDFGGGDFQIAKGKYEYGESPRQAAFREANEELGLKESNVKSDHQLGIFLGYTTVFIAGVKDVDDFEDFHFETAETKWMTADEFEKDGRKIHKPIVREAYVFINKKESE